MNKEKEIPKHPYPIRIRRSISEDTRGSRCKTAMKYAVILTRFIARGTDGQEAISDWVRQPAKNLLFDSRQEAWAYAEKVLKQCERSGLFVGYGKSLTMCQQEGNAEMHKRCMSALHGRCPIKGKLWLPPLMNKPKSGGYLHFYIHVGRIQVLKWLDTSE
jgi:hypothetical protein